MNGAMEKFDMNGDFSRWSEMKYEDKLFVAREAETSYKIYVREHGHKPDAKARKEIVKTVRAKAEERGIALRKLILDRHIDKLLVRLARDKPIQRKLKRGGPNRNAEPA